jgi:hypothetical protein
MSDRELLEMAAKAFWGKEIDDTCSIRWLENDQAIGYIHGENQDHNGKDQEFIWSPLTDDGDALRLAAKLQIDIESGAAYAQATWYDLDLSETHEVLEYFDHEQERLPTIRLCIVRAAAEIGKAMP